MFSNYYPSHCSYSPYDAAYARALAEERAARNQYAAALRAQEEARQRAARARLARHAYASASPYTSYLPDDDEDTYTTYPGQSVPAGYASAYGLSPQQRRALAELEREREKQQRLAQIDEERRRLFAAAEQERQRRLLEEEERRKVAQQEEMNRRRRSAMAMEEIYRQMGLATPFEHPEFVSSPLTVIPKSSYSFINVFQNTARTARTASPSNRDPSPAPTPAPATEPTQPVRIPIHDNTAELASAAEKIQTFYRTHVTRHKALQTIADIDSRFQTLKSQFTLPRHVDFQGATSGTPVTVDTLTLPPLSTFEDFSSDSESESEDGSSSVPRLAYSTTNGPIHQYDEDLNQLLGKLDAVESGGDKAVRERRRELVRSVEREATRIEKWKEAVWRAFKGPEVSSAQEVEVTSADVPMETQAPEAPADSEVQVAQSEPTDVPIDSESAVEFTATPTTVSVDNVPAPLDIPDTTMDFEPSSALDSLDDSKHVASLGSAVTDVEPSPSSSSPSPNLDDLADSRHLTSLRSAAMDVESSPLPTSEPEQLSATTADEPDIEVDASSPVLLPHTSVPLPEEDEDDNAVLVSLFDEPSHAEDGFVLC